jgi:hypothetical protein
MANVIRVTYEGFDGRLNIDKGVLTLYGGKSPTKWDITKKENTNLLREFLNTAYAKGKHPSKILIKGTGKNLFEWVFYAEKGWVLGRWNIKADTYSVLKPDTEFTKKVLSALVRANVK